MPSKDSHESASYEQASETSDAGSHICTQVRNLTRSTWEHTLGDSFLKTRSVQRVCALLFATTRDAVRITYEVCFIFYQPPESKTVGIGSTLKAAPQSGLIMYLMREKTLIHHGDRD